MQPAQGTSEPCVKHLADRVVRTKAVPCQRRHEGSTPRPYFIVISSNIINLLCSASQHAFSTRQPPSVHHRLGAGCRSHLDCVQMHPLRHGPRLLVQHQGFQQHARLLEQVRVAAANETTLPFA
jgi:hypothetical protein